MKQIEIFDSTLRDGAQSEGISFSVQDKLNIVKALDNFGVSYIEAGNPGSNPKDLAFFEQVQKICLKNAKLCAFGSTHRKNVPVEQDANIQSLLAANTPVVAIFGKAWNLHVTEILKISAEDNLALVRDTVSYLKEQGKEVIFDAEHFFDGYKEKKEYALQVLQAAADGGADCLCLCDTNGGALPNEIFSAVSEVSRRFSSKKIAIHCHDDIGCAVASSMLAVEAGASQVQGTFIGFGERCGNADLSVIIPNLRLKYRMDCDGNLPLLSKTAVKIAEISNIPLRSNKPYIGRSAFAHKGGMHIDGVQKISRSFEHVDPEQVGNERKFLMSEVSGRTTVLAKIKDYAPDLTKDSPQTALIVEKLKELEHFGYQFEAADASFEILVKKLLGHFTPHFNLVLYKTTGEFPAPDGKMQSSAMIQIKVDGKAETTASVGNGPVNALDLALRKALMVFYPELKRIHLTDYKVRVFDTGQATGAKVRVLIESTDGTEVWTTVGVSTDIIEASWNALVDSIEYKLTKLDEEMKTKE